MGGSRDASVCLPLAGPGLGYRLEGASALSDVLLGLHPSQPPHCPPYLEPGSVPPAAEGSNRNTSKVRGKSDHPGIEHVCGQCGQPARPLPGPMLSTRERALAGHDDQSVPVRGWPGRGGSHPHSPGPAFPPHPPLPCCCRNPNRPSRRQHPRFPSGPTARSPHGESLPPQVGSCRALESKRSQPHLGEGPVSRDCLVAQDYGSVAASCGQTVSEMADLGTPGCGPLSSSPPGV